jgi:hypothetical protein
MLTIVLYVLAGIFGVSIFWLVYCGVQGFRSRWATLHWSAKILGGPGTGLFLIVDFLVNLLASIPFKDLPRELTLSTRLKRYHQATDSPKSTAVAGFICDKWLDPFDPSGDHC